MKRNKILICATATILSVCAIGTTVALYSNTASHTITIGGSIQKNEGMYSLSDLTYNENAAINPGSHQVGSETTEKNYYEASTKMSINAENFAYTQDTVLGTATLKLTVNTAALSYLTITAGARGYTVSDNYWASHCQFDITGGTVSGTNTVFNLSTTVAFSSTATQELYIHIETINDITDEQFLQYVAEKSISYEFGLKANSTVVTPFILGNFNNWSTTNGRLEMVPDLTVASNDTFNTEESWKYDNVAVTASKEYKALKGEKWIGDAYKDGSPNWSTDKNGIYNFYVRKTNEDKAKVKDYYIGASFVRAS